MAFPLLGLLQAIPAVTSLFGMLNPPKAPKAPPVLDWGQAMQRANAIMQPQLEEALKGVDADSVSRGFFGQLPAAEMRQNAAVQWQGNVASLANEMVGRSEQIASQYALEAARNKTQWQSGLGSNVNQWGNAYGAGASNLFGLASMFANNTPRAAGVVSSGMGQYPVTPGYDPRSYVEGQKLSW